MLVFFQNGKTEYNYVNVLWNIFMPLFPYYAIKSNILFILLNVNKWLEQHTGFSTFIFEIGARLKQPVYLCIWPSECLGDLHRLLS